jgi:hypothetical protein
VFEAFVELEYTGQWSYFEQAGDEQSKDEKQDAEQIKYVFVTLNNRKGDTAYRSEKHSQKGVGSDEAENEKESNKQGFFLRFGRTGNETERHGNTHNCA